MSRDTSRHLQPLEPRTLLSTAYRLIDLPFAPVDINNTGQILGDGAIYQVRKGGRLHRTPLPTASGDPNARLVLHDINNNGDVIGTELVPRGPGGGYTRFAYILCNRDSRGRYGTRTLPLSLEDGSPHAINDLKQIIIFAQEPKLLTLRRGRAFLIHLK